jgi:glycosyltransferase involved in cell wall biosynthesis
MEKKKKIIHIIQSLGNGGCENMLLRTLPLLGDFDHTIITLKNPGDLAPKFIDAGVKVKTTHWPQLRKQVLLESPDIIITYLFHADMLGRIFLRIKNTPVIPFLRTTYNHPKYLIARILEWMTKSLVNQYLANSVAVKDFYIKHIGVHPEKITVIPNGIDIEYFDSITPNPDLRKSLSIAPSDFVIICVANLHINKGHHYLLEAFEVCDLKNVKLLIVGDGDEKENLLHQIENYRSKENIIFLGRRTDVPQLLKISNLFMLPTLFEGQSNAIMEAMAAGIPIITTDIPENRALIENTASGILVPTQDSQAITQAINTLIIDEGLSNTLGKGGKKFLEQNFSLKASVNSFHQFLNSL